jgi:hypothetical protein
MVRVPPPVNCDGTPQHGLAKAWRACAKNVFKTLETKENLYAIYGTFLRFRRCPPLEMGKSLESRRSTS